jgi:hypothetical protein
MKTRMVMPLFIIIVAIVMKVFFHYSLLIAVIAPICWSTGGIFTMLCWALLMHQKLNCFFKPLFDSEFNYERLIGVIYGLGLSVIMIVVSLAVFAAYHSHKPICAPRKNS